MVDFYIRRAEKKDCKDIMILMTELADYFESDRLKLTVQDLQRDGFCENPRFYCYVAQAGNVAASETAPEERTVIGFSMIHLRYCVYTGNYLHMNGLYVKKEHRAKGIGSALFNKVVTFGQENQCKSLEWKLSKPFPETISFYLKLGAEIKQNNENEHNFKKTLL